MRDYRNGNVSASSQNRRPTPFGRLVDSLSPLVDDHIRGPSAAGRSEVVFEKAQLPADDDGAVVLWHRPGSIPG